MRQAVSWIEQRQRGEGDHGELYLRAASNKRLGKIAVCSKAVRPVAPGRHFHITIFACRSRWPWIGAAVSVGSLGAGVGAAVWGGPRLRTSPRERAPYWV
jgi:hypothetical protein